MPVVAIDGPAGAGKSTIARRVAEDLGWAYLDSGAMYRAVTVLALDRDLDLGDEEALAALVEGLDLELTPAGEIRVAGEDLTGRIRTPAVTEAVSRVAAVPAVRAQMRTHQQRFAQRNDRVVAEGRDMGTVVFPDADLKVFLVADSRERARRRLAQWGPEAAGDLESVKSDIETRDRRDATRADSPLRQSPDAWRLDTSKMTLDEVFEAVRDKVRSAIRP